jgi:hypothetical protein
VVVRVTKIARDGELAMKRRKICEGLRRGQSDEAVGDRAGLRRQRETPPICLPAALKAHSS